MPYAALPLRMVGVPIIGFIGSALKRKGKTKWVQLDSLDTFPVGETRLAKFRNPFTVPWDGYTADLPCWVRRIEEKKFQVFAINCAHLGCPVRWFRESKLFMCPCHGGIYYADGSRASGPPPRGLFTYPHKINKGHLWIKAGYVPTINNPT